MSSDMRELYQEIILDHNKSPKNFRSMEAPDRKIDAFNPLCGDHYTIYIRFDGDTIADTATVGSRARRAARLAPTCSPR